MSRSRKKTRRQKNPHQMRCTSMKPRRSQNRQRKKRFYRSTYYQNYKNRSEYRRWANFLSPFFLFDRHSEAWMRKQSRNARLTNERSRTCGRRHATRCNESRVRRLQTTIAQLHDTTQTQRRYCPRGLRKNKKI